MERTEHSVVHTGTLHNAHVRIIKHTVQPNANVALGSIVNASARTKLCKHRSVCRTQNNACAKI